VDRFSLVYYIIIEVKTRPIVSVASDHVLQMVVVDENPVLVVHFSCFLRSTHCVKDFFFLATCFFFIFLSVWWTGDAKR